MDSAEGRKKESYGFGLPKEKNEVMYLGAKKSKSYGFESKNYVFGHCEKIIELWIRPAGEFYL